MKRFLLDGRYGAVLQSFGLQPIAVLKKAGLPVTLFTQEHPVITQDAYFRLMTTIADLMPDESVPIRMATMESIETFSPPIFAAYCSCNGLACLHRLARYKRLIGPLALDICEDGDVVCLSLAAADRQTPLPVFVVETEMVFFVHLLRKAVKEPLKPVAATLATAIPGQAFARFLGVQPKLGGANVLTFSRSDLEKPFISENETMWQYFEPEMNKRLSELTVDDSFSAQVRSVLTELLPAGEGTSHHVADRMGISTRTLQRRLKDEGTTFQKVLSGTREVLARHYLRHTDMTTQDIAFLLGYAEVNSFLRAFAIWTGQTVRAFRKGDLNEHE